MPERMRHFEDVPDADLRALRVPTLIAARRSRLVTDPSTRSSSRT